MTGLTRLDSAPVAILDVVVIIPLDIFSSNFVNVAFGKNSTLPIVYILSPA